MNITGKPVIWIGIYRPPGGALAEFVYTSGGASVNYTNWLTAEPNRKHSSQKSPPDCVAIYGTLNNTWRDAACGGESNYYICELEPK